jgi:hypothetical protein
VKYSKQNIWTDKFFVGGQSQYLLKGFNLW